jgi:hypothetical protein
MDRSNLAEVKETILIMEEEEEMEGIVRFVKELIILLTLVIRSMDIHQTGEEVVETLMLIWLMEMI